jgi:hypothetical protein
MKKQEGNHKNGQTDQMVHQIGQGYGNGQDFSWNDRLGDEGSIVRDSSTTPDKGILKHEPGQDSTEKIKWKVLRSHPRVQS